MRAAFARAITDRCNYERKNRWVSFENKDECSGCAMNKICRDFDKIKFSFMYPFGSIPYPVTNMRCKYDDSHPNVDILIYKINKHRWQDVRFNNICPAEGCEERLEKYAGLHRDNRDIEVDYIHITKNGINPYLRRSKEGLLYSLNVVNEKCIFERKLKSTKFSGCIECDDEIKNALDEVDVIRVGAYTTSGFGKCTLNAIENESDDDISSIKERVKQFNNRINDDLRFYISFTLTSDAYLGLEKCFNSELRPSQVSIAEYIEHYAKVLKQYTGKDLKFEFPIVTNEVRRGFDTSKDEAVYRKSRIVSKAGSIFVFSIPKESIDYNGLLKIQNTGIGDNTEHGFGQVMVCSEFHYKMAMK